MYKFALKIKDLATINFYTDMLSVKKKMVAQPEFVTKAIPITVEYIGECERIEEARDTIVLLDNEKKSISINKMENNAHVVIPEGDLRFPDIAYLAMGMFTNILQDQDKYFFHSSVVKYDDTHSIMILGDQYAGKTTLAYKLMKDYGFKLISNDNAVAGIESNDFRTYTGTKMMQMRLGGIRLYFPELLSQVKYDKSGNPDEWETKIYINRVLEGNGLGYADESIITDIYNINTYRTSEVSVRPIEEVDKKLLMYESLMKSVRNIRGAIMGFDYPMPSFEKEDKRQSIYDTAARIVSSTAIYDARGSVDEIAKRMVLSCGKK